MDSRPISTRPGRRRCGRHHWHALPAALATALIVAAATVGAAEDGEPETWIINSPSVDMLQFITQVAQITGKTFVIDPRIKGNVSVISQAELDRDGVYELLLSVLRVHGIGAVPVGDGDVVHIIQNVTAVKQSGGVVGEAPDGPAQEIVTRLIPVQNVQATELVKILRPMSPQHGHVGAIADRNVIIISDHANNVERLRQVIRELDVLNDDEVVVRALEHAWAGSVVSILEQVAPEQMAKGAVGPQSIRIIANERNNSLLLRGKPQPLSVVNDLIDKLDVPATAMSNTQVIHLSYADATELAETLNQLVGGGAAGESDSPLQTTIQADTGLNAIVARTNPRTMDEIFNIVKQLDTRRAQVLIEAAIAEVSVTDLFSAGVETAAADERGRAIPAFNATLNGIIGALLGGSDTETVSPVDVLSQADSPTMGVAKLDRDGVTFALVLNALSTNTAADLLSAPSVLTLDNQQATIQAGQEVPFRTGSFSTLGEGTTNPFTTVQRQDVGITLQVTPHVHEGTAVRLEIMQEGVEPARFGAGAERGRPHHPEAHDRDDRARGKRRNHRSRRTDPERLPGHGQESPVTRQHSPRRQAVPQHVTDARQAAPAGIHSPNRRADAGRRRPGDRPHVRLHLGGPDLLAFADTLPRQPVRGTIRGLSHMRREKGDRRMAALCKRVNFAVAHAVVRWLIRPSAPGAAATAIAARRPLHLGGSIWWAWRGSIWKWGGHRFGALGGAVSPDRRDLAAHGMRWSDEATTAEDLKRLIGNVQAEFGGKLDVLFTHDAPAQVQNLKPAMANVPADLRHAAEEVRRLLAEAVERTDPAYVLHGHWHQPNHERVRGGTEVFGLSADGSHNSTALLTARPALGVAHAAGRTHREPALHGLQNRTAPPPSTATSPGSGAPAPDEPASQET